MICQSRQAGTSGFAIARNTFRAGRQIVKPVWIIGFVLIATCCFGQAPSESLAPTATMKQLMLDLIHPASNDILLMINRGGPENENDWATVRRSALTLAEAGNLLMMPGRARDDSDWPKDVKMLVDAGNSAYKAAEAKNAQALAAVAAPLDASCTNCHKQYRPNVFPRQGGAK
jgi:cytochrome c556